MKLQPYLLIICTILAIGGICSGIIAWIVLPDVLNSQLQTYVTEQIQTNSVSLTLRDSITTVLQANSMDIIRVYLFGICLAGIPLLIIFLLIKCFSIGFVICVLLQHSFFLAVTRVLYIPIFIIAAQIAVTFAFKLISNQMDRPIRQLLKYTCIFFFVMLGVFAVSILDGLNCYYYFLNL